jgi:hypothetical protein
VTDLATAIRDNVARVIRDADANNPRSLQAAIGPSEYGHPCQRRIAYKTLGWPEVNQASDPLKRNIGTAGHAWLERIFGELTFDETMPSGEPRYATEQRVQAPGAPAGSCDLLDRKLHVAIDWKFVGPTALKDYRRSNDPGPTYRTQAHTYGAGWLHRGEQVDEVAVVFLPRNGELKDMHVWTEPLDPAVVEAAVARWQALIGTVAALDVEDHPERFAWIAANPTRLCSWCSFFSPMSTDLGKGCPGNTAGTTANDVLMRGAA